jgi:hypothetical protein
MYIKMIFEYKLWGYISNLLYYDAFLSKQIKIYLNLMFKVEYSVEIVSAT